MHRLLTNWDHSLSEEQHRALDISLERRSFLSHSLKAATTVGLWPALISLQACSEDPVRDQRQLIREQPWQTFAYVQQILFPDDGNGPSAMDIHATLYLKFVLNASDTAATDRDFILNGVGWLDDLSKTRHGRLFVACDLQQREQLLKHISQSRSGERWLSTLLVYVFEALLSDPVYGGNPNGIGWQWLQHQPGFPQPPTTKTYPKLL